MKKILIVAALLLSGVALNAKPVGLDEARGLSERFVQSNFALSRQSTSLDLVYSMPAFYVFNVGSTGFVILSSDDSYRPLIGYSDEGTFNPDDMAPALRDYLEGLNAYRTQRGTFTPSLEVARDWEMMRQTGHPVSRHGGREATYLVTTKWNQNYPYNYYCPADAAGPGGHAYAGCVATAAAQLMKYWDHPLQGTGSHSYTPEDNPQYGVQTANFGETTYDWDNMPNSISSSSPIEKIQAVALLIYHVGVSVDMNYRPSGSGAVTGQLCNTMPAYFFYTNQMQNLPRENYTHEAYMQLVIDAIDMSWPMVHRGGGHAYVLDGYDDYDQVHFNWGWSGSSDGWFNIDDHGYTDGESVIYNYVPAAVYSATPKAPTSLTVVPADDNALAATVSWVNPSTTLTNQPLSAIDQVVVMRNNEVVYTEDNVTPGATMSIVDETVPCFDVFKYTVYTVINGQRGKSVVADGINIGPSCDWNFVVSSTNFLGWRGGYVSIQNAAGHEVDRVTLTSSAPASVSVSVPLGGIKMLWSAPTMAGSFTMTLNIKDSENQSVYTYSGSGTDLAAGVLYEGNNGCGNTPDCGTPSNLTAIRNPEDLTSIRLSWTGVENPGYGYMIYRDSVMYRLVNDGSTEFLDENVPLGGHSYQVATLCEGGWNGMFSNMVCESSGPLYAPNNLRCEMTANFKCKLIWDAPEVMDGVSAYFIYRRTDDTEFKRIKILSVSHNDFTDNTTHVEGDYYYKVVSFYNDYECTSAPAAYINDPHQYFLHFYYSPTAADEQLADGVKLYPNPTRNQLVVEAKGMTCVEICNVLGQRVMTRAIPNGEVKMTLDLQGFESGLYMVRIFTENGVMTKQFVKQ